MHFSNPLTSLPSVESILNEHSVTQHIDSLGRPFVTSKIRKILENIRGELVGNPQNQADRADIIQSVIKQLDIDMAEHCRKFFTRVVNATGIILHTGLGRAVLAKSAMERVAEEMNFYSRLQIDLETGLRSRRDERIEYLVKYLTGGQSATVVNNNAAATALVLNTVGKGREIIVSRGQLVEIGGSFRLPEVMAASGAKLVEVGSTNKTHAYDYRNAINENTAAIMRVHPSNYRIIGFTAEVELSELVAIAHAHDLPLIDDIGAGALIDFSQFGFDYEPTIMDSINNGADIVTCSCDKLIGGPQGGLIIGKSSLVEKCRKNPLSRVVRVDKFTLALLEATLELFFNPQRALAEIPTLAMLSRDIAELDSQARRIVSAVSEQVPDAGLQIIDGFSQMGSGSLPSQQLPTKLVAIKARISESDVVRNLRHAKPIPVIARVQDGQSLIDPRTLLDGDEQVVISALVSVLSANA